MCSGGVLSTLLLNIVARCLETIDVCIWCMLNLIYVEVNYGVCGNVCCVAAILLDLEW